MLRHMVVSGRHQLVNQKNVLGAQICAVQVVSVRSCGWISLVTKDDPQGQRAPEGLF
jgi:hypothetical protein